MDHRIVEVGIRVANIYGVFFEDQCASISHTLCPLNPYNDLVSYYYSCLHRDGNSEALRDHRTRGGRTQIRLTLECGIWSHFTNEETEPQRSKETCLKALLDCQWVN